jgi:hypothetical protein
MPDVQCTFAQGSFKNGQIGEFAETPGFSVGVPGRSALSGPESERPGGAPAINPHYLPEESDRRAIVGGLAWRGGCSPPRRCRRN